MRWAVVCAAWGSVGLVRRGLRGGRNVGVLAGGAEEGAFGEAGRKVSGGNWNVEVVAIVEVDDGVAERGGTVGVTVTLSAVELGAELGRPRGGGSWRERIVLGLTFGGVPEFIVVAAAEAAVVEIVDRGTPIVFGDGGPLA